MNPDMSKQLREFQKENALLRKVVSDRTVDIAILKEAAQKRSAGRSRPAELR
jgi:hypothetical protein